jgi:Tfp pilus assembly protein PilN
MVLSRFRPWIVYGLGACAAGVGVLAAWQHAVSREGIAVERNAYIQREIAKLKKEVEEIAGLGNAKAAYDAYARTAHMVRERRVVPAAEALAELSRLPQKVVLQSVTVEMNRLTAIGEAASESDLAAVLPVLQGARFIAKARITASPSSPGKRGFRLDAEISKPASLPSPDKGTRQ